MAILKVCATPGCGILCLGGTCAVCEREPKRADKRRVPAAAARG